MNLKITCRLLSLGLMALGVGATAPSCGGSTAGDDGGTDGVTHWLDRCSDDTDCGDLECLCGVCTTRCARDSACAAFAEAATCSILQGCPDAFDDAVCTLPGTDGGCSPETRCAPVECRPMDARSDGTLCFALLGYSFTGETCAPVICGCEGTECQEIFASAAACRTTYADCLREAADPCAPMDARSSGDDCADVAGLTWNGDRCEAIPCGCEGSNCDQLYANLGPCEQAHLTCNVDLAPQCQRSADCILDFADCCGRCGVTPVDGLVAVRADAWETYRARACPAGSTCPACAASISPDALALCVGFQCTPIDTEPVTRCATDVDCHLRYKDCCECDSLPSAANLIAVSDLVGYQQLACTEGFACATCDTEYPPEARAACVAGHCTVEDLGNAP
jgi:hypothetical protein